METRKTIIDSYAALPLGLYMDIDSVLDDSSLSDLDQQVRIIALLSNRSEDEVLDLPLAEYARMSAATAFLRERCTPSPSVSDTYPLHGFTLVPTKDYTRLTTAQYIDFQTFSRDGVKALPQLLSVLLVPKDHTYNDGYDIAAVQNAIRSELSLPDALALSAFFFARLKQSIEAILAYLTPRRLRRLNPEQRRTLTATLEAARESLTRAGAGSQT